MAERRFDGRVAIVTGVRRPNGIGRAICRRLASEGAALALADLVIEEQHEEQLAGAVAEMQLLGARALSCPVDVALPEDVRRLVATTLGEFGRLDVLVNNAAFMGGSGAATDLDFATWERSLAVIAGGTFLCCREAAKVMGPGGAIINTLTEMIRVAQPRSSAYSSAKAAVAQLTRVLATELAPRGIRVNAVSPGLTDTADESIGDIPSYARDYRIDLEQARRRFALRFPLGRLGRPDDIAAAVAFLASGDASYITGHDLLVDGGQTLTID